MFNGEFDSCDRRTYLKKAAVGVGSVMTVPAVTSAESSGDAFRRKIKTANRIRERAGHQARERFLRNNDVRVGTKASSFEFQKGPDEDSNGVSTQEVECVEGQSCNSGLKCTLSIATTYTSPEFYVDLTVEYRYRSYWSDYGFRMPEGGEMPVDAGGISWKENHWELMNQENADHTTSTSSNVEWEDGSYNGNQMAYRYDDRQACVDSGTTGNNREWSDPIYGGVYLVTGDEWESDSEIHAVYEHTWNSGEVSGIAIGYPWAISVSASSKTDSEDTQTKRDGETFLRVTNDDAH